ncbi:Zinc finger transcription factor ace1 [Verticillium dahliae VDG1]|nr:Zinc finger transcription factor ace1 [Verticillium dahliae VDG1]
MQFSTVSLAAALFGAATVIAQSSDQASCSLTKKCPEEAPCCSQYGACGVGAYCLGGCDPRMSFSLDSCAPAPVCKDMNMKMDSTDSIVDVSKYLGDGDKADWVVQGEAVEAGGNVLLTMPKGSVGTVMASSHYMWYGSVKARMKTSRGRGVVTAFILLSDVKDEIDYEWVGVDLKTSQTNYYFQGIPLYDQSKNITLSDTFNNWHEYEIQWTPDKITWLVNGQVGRVKERKDTWNETTQGWDFPQTPARVQLSIWPGGLESNAKGTIDWAGGVIDWEHEDIKKVGYFYAAVSDVEINGRDTEENDDGKETDSATKTKSAASATNTGASSNQIPGAGAANPGGGVTHGEDGDSSSGSGSGSGGGDDSGSSGSDIGSSGPIDDSNCDSSEFNQDMGNCGGNSQGQGSSTGSSGSSDSPSMASSLGLTQSLSALAGLAVLAGLYRL